MLTTMKEIKSNNGFKKLLEEIKKTKEEDTNYRPKNYSFNLDSFNDEGNEKK